MRTWEKAATVAAMAGLAWVFWYDHLACPACKAEAQREATRRGRERHNRNHRRGS